MVVLSYRERAAGEPQTFTGVVVGTVVRVILYWRRNESMPLLRMALDAAARHTREYDQYHLTRMGAESAKLDNVPLGDGLATEPVYFISVPELILNEWMRKTG